MNRHSHSKSPIIGISATLLPIETGCFMGRERSCIVHDYICAVKEAGGVPIILPVIDDKEMILQQVELIDGLILSGGQDVHPLLYKEEPEPALEYTCIDRDQYELELIRLAVGLKKPVFGICRGLQLLNVAFGGTLFQDIRSHLPTALQHNQKTNPQSPSHTVDLVEGTILHEIIGSNMTLTNSYHHQAVKSVAPGFIVNARAKDGVVEGIEKIDHPFILGVQWHPELMFASHLDTQKLFKAFVETSKIQETALIK